MAFSRITELFNITCEGRSHAAAIKEIKLPDLKRKYTPHQSGGMDTPVFVDLGGEGLEAELTFAGICPDDIVIDYTALKHMGKTWAYRGYIRDQQTGVGQGVEVVMRGRHNIDNPTIKHGDAGDTKIKVYLSYYKQTVDGKVLNEIDPVAGIHIVNGEDKLADARNFLGI